MKTILGINITCKVCASAIKILIKNWKMSDLYCIYAEGGIIFLQMWSMLSVSYGS